jgi:hypothetical protein
MEAWFGLIGVVVGALATSGVQWRLESRRIEQEEVRREHERTESRRAEKLAAYSRMMEALDATSSSITLHLSRRVDGTLADLNMEHYARTRTNMLGPFLEAMPAVLLLGGDDVRQRCREMNRQFNVSAKRVLGDYMAQDEETKQSFAKERLLFMMSMRLELEGEEPLNPSIRWPPQEPKRGSRRTRRRAKKLPPAGLS